MSQTTISTNSVCLDTTFHNKFRYNPATTTGLTFGYKAGKYAVDGNTVEVAAGTIALTDNATNVVQISLTGVISATTLGNESAFPLYKVTTASGAITAIVDLRSTYQQ